MKVKKLTLRWVPFVAHATKNLHITNFFFFYGIVTISCLSHKVQVQYKAGSEAGSVRLSGSFIVPGTELDSIFFFIGSAAEVDLKNS